MELVQIAVADAAVCDLDLDVQLAHLTPREAEWREVTCTHQARLHAMYIHDLHIHIWCTMKERARSTLACLQQHYNGRTTQGKLYEMAWVLCTYVKHLSSIAHPSFTTGVLAYQGEQQYNTNTCVKFEPRGWTARQHSSTSKLKVKPIASKLFALLKTT